MIKENLEKLGLLPGMIVRSIRASGNSCHTPRFVQVVTVIFQLQACVLSHHAILHMPIK